MKSDPSYTKGTIASTTTRRPTDSTTISLASTNSISRGSGGNNTTNTGTSASY
eukprot:CAMPEP_0113426442 /NCGR_PEP_ID=MMETSP0013_2-20120614/30732_1 /TAXON_ID=2843 ORGANISM="Skeletonema costatum, Strain 1716" /NCGR_SAMPLE_ID=MMETSP0013_2 /ASSEMBLY_ACC=CAM_ASM_000158 /LENGTH=52 /DNA_ID=CAMNT_0000314725 /DNA_START=9 /DNA_END=164 /DNA_ORIENTATION=+ /assembly_acc=CAM_ASM_000158